MVRTLTGPETTDKLFGGYNGEMAVTRPLSGEPLPLDLVNTVWIDRDDRVDLFDDAGAVKDWLGEHELTVDAPLDAVKERLAAAREAIRDVLYERDGAQSRLNEVLDHGSRRPRLREGKPETADVVDDPAWLPGWRCAAAFLDLLERRPDRIRKCANPACVLWYLDTTKNGGRRWCSMEMCGNRAKVKRFHQRHGTSGP